MMMTTRTREKEDAEETAYLKLPRFGYKKRGEEEEEEEEEEGQRMKRMRKGRREKERDVEFQKDWL